MSTELLKEPDGVDADVHVKLQSDLEPPSTGDPGKSLIKEVDLLRQQVQQLCQIVRGLVSLQAVMDRKLDAALKGGTGCDVAVL